MIVYDSFVETLSQLFAVPMGHERRREWYRIFRAQQLAKRMREDMAARGQYLNGRDNR